MEHFRMKAPNAVLRSSCARLQPVSWLALTRMERNLYIIKVFLFSPTRCWRKITGPGLDSLTPMATAAMMGLLTRISARLPRMSNSRLTKALKMLSKGVCRTLMSLQLPSVSMVGRAGR